MNLADKLWRSYFVGMYVVLFIFAGLIAVFLLGFVGLISWHDIQSYFIMQHMVIVAVFFVFYYMIGVFIAGLTGWDETEESS